MRINDIVTELFEPTASLKPYSHGKLNGYTFMADGREYFVGFKGDSYDGEYYMSFTGQDDQGRHSPKLLGHNKPYAVFSGVMAAILRFIKEHDPSEISFTVDTSEMKRGSVYDRMLDAAEERGLFPDEYTWDRDGNHNYYIFKKGYR